MNRGAQLLVFLASSFVGASAQGRAQQAPPTDLEAGTSQEESTQPPSPSQASGERAVMERFEPHVARERVSNRESIHRFRPVAYEGRTVQILIAAASGSGIAAFHMIPESNCRRRWVDDENGCIGWLIQTGDFGPKTINHRYWLEHERDYYLIPVCANRLQWRNNQLARGSTDVEIVELRCQNP